MRTSLISLKANDDFSPERIQQKQKQKDYIGKHRTMSVDGEFSNYPTVAKTMILESKLHIYREFMEKNQEKNKREMEIEQERMANLIAERRQNQLQTLRNNKEFLVEANKAAIEKWQESQNILAFGIQKELNFEKRMTKIMKDKAIESSRFHQEDFKDGLYSFVDNLQRLGIEIKHNSEQVHKSNIKTVEHL